MTGQWPTPQAQAYWQAMQGGGAPYPAFGGWGGMPGTIPSAPWQDPEQELTFLKDQAGALKTQIEQINSRIKELGKAEKKE